MVHSSMAEAVVAALQLQEGMPHSTHAQDPNIKLTTQHGFRVFAYIATYTGLRGKLDFAS